MKSLLTHNFPKGEIRLRSDQDLILFQKPKLFKLGMLAFMMLLNIQVWGQYDCCEYTCDNWWNPKFLTLKSGIEDGDTIHTSSCQVPPKISPMDLVYYKDLKDVCFHDHSYLTVRSSFFFRKHFLKISAHRYSAEVPEDADPDVFKVWKYEYRIRNEYCGKEYKLTYYVFQHDHGAPTFQCFPRDTTVASIADVPAPSKMVNIIDICQYGILDSLITEAVVDSTTGDTIKFVRTWYASDPSGNTSSKSQMIWIDPDAGSESSALPNWTVVNTTEWTLYPNPARHQVKISISGDADWKYNIYDALGQTIKTGAYHRGETINLENMSPGMYHIRLQNNKAQTTGVKKFMVLE